MSLAARVSRLYKFIYFGYFLQVLWSFQRTFFISTSTPYNQCLTFSTLPKTSTIGGYIYQASAATSTYTLLTNPTTHYYGGSSGGNATILPNNPNTWIPYSSNIPKSIYDPCPYGYRVPTDGSWTGMTGNTWTQYAIIGGTAWNSSWWPGAGFRQWGGFKMQGVGDSGWYWSSTPSFTVTHVFILSFYCNNGVGPRTNGYRSNVMSVRCIEER